VANAGNEGEGEGEGTVRTSIKDDQVIVSKLVSDERPECGKIISGGNDVSKAFVPL
jgi:hypothetical protein